MSGARSSASALLFPGACSCSLVLCSKARPIPLVNLTIPVPGETREAGTLPVPMQERAGLSIPFSWCVSNMLQVHSTQEDSCTFANDWGQKLKTTSGITGSNYRDLSVSSHSFPTACYLHTPGLSTQHHTCVFYTP